MHRTLILVAGLLGLGVLAWWCLRTEIPKIEADISTRSTAALRAAGLPVAALIEGQDVTLAGNVATGEARDLAVSTVAGLPGVRRVVDRIKVNAPALAPAPERYEFTVTAAQDEVRLLGYVRDDAARASIVGAARRLFEGRQVLDQLAVSAAAPPGFDAAMRAGLAELVHFDRGRLDVSDGQIRLSGVLADAAIQTALAERLRGGLADGYAATLNASLAPPSAARISDCQRDFDRLLVADAIQFGSGSATISADSFPLLDRLAAAVKACTGVRVEVAGHTDSRGNRQANLTLSKRRAQAVVDYLATEGVASAQLIARGYGVAQPVADNDTAAGRARNRRIEFRAGTAEESP